MTQILSGDGELPGDDGELVVRMGVVSQDGYLANVRVLAHGLDLKPEDTFLDIVVERIQAGVYLAELPPGGLTWSIVSKLPLKLLAERGGTVFVTLRCRKKLRVRVLAVMHPEERHVSARYALELVPR